MSAWQQRVAVGAIFALLALGIANPVARSRQDAFAGIPSPVRASDFGQYPLDQVSREVDPHHVRCPDIALTMYRGTHIPLDRPARLYVPFRNRVVAFEELARDVAIEVYGRAPSRMHHLGTYNCRAVRSFPDTLSEHGLGNAIDIQGFDFAPAAAAASVPHALPRALRRAFSVSVQSHWHATRGVAAVHARFLLRLETELRAHPGMFRGMLGPAYPHHHDHLHLDMAPWSLVWM